ncbi:MAG: glycerophosphodiester phosphodiesterase family protein [Bacteroidota bacterium]
MYLNKKTVALFCFTLLLWGCQFTKDQPKAENPAIADVVQVNDAKAITSFEQWLKDPEPLISAHRGGPYPGFPENAIETFQNIADQTPVVIECDVTITKDGVLILMHDQTLDRTTTGEGIVMDLMYEDVENLLLVDNEGDNTSFHIPTLEEVLTWGRGKVLFTLDVKRGVPYDKVVDMVDKLDAASYAAIITYRIKDAKLVYSLNADLMISVSARDDRALEQIAKSGIPTKNLLGFVGTREPEPGHYKKLQKRGIKTILGTLGNLDKKVSASGSDDLYLRYFENGANIISTDRPLEVSEVLMQR